MTKSIISINKIYTSSILYRNEYTRLYGSIDQEKLLASTTQLIMEQEINSREAPLENGVEEQPPQESRNQQPNNYGSISQSQDNTNPLIPNDGLNNKNSDDNDEKSSRNESNGLIEDRKNSSVGVESQEDDGEWSPAADSDLMVNILLTSCISIENPRGISIMSV